MKLNISTKEFLSKGTIVLICLLCFSFPITSSIPFFLGTDSYAINLLVRLIYLALTLIVLIASFQDKASSRITIAGRLMLLFWTVYSFRFLHDTLVKDLVIRGNIFKLYAICFGNCLLPTITILRVGKHIKLNQLKIYSISTLLFSCIVILVILYNLHGTLNPSLILDRARFTVSLEDGRQQDVLNPITIGFHGETLYLMALANVLLNKVISKKEFWLSLFCVVVGFWVLILGASRGPALGALVGSIIIFILHAYYLRKSSCNLFAYVASIFTVALLSAYYIIPQMDQLNFRLINRIIAFANKASVEGGGGEVRTYQWEAAMNGFLSSPIIGDRYLERFSNYYPHNVYLEIFMSTGLVGAVIIYPAIIYAVWRVMKLIKVKSVHIVLFFPLLSIGFWALTSSSIFEGVALWCYLSFWISADLYDYEV